MTRKWVWRWVGFSLVAVLTALPLYITSQVTLESERLIFHRVWDRVNHRLMGVAWDGPSAQDVIETEKTVLNDVWDRATNSLRILGGEEELGPDTVGSAEVINNALTGDDVDESTFVLTNLIGAAEVNESALVLTNLISTGEVVDNSLTGTDINESTLVLTGLIGAAEVADNTLTGTDINESTLVLTGLIGTGEVANDTLTGSDINEATLVIPISVITEFDLTTIPPIEGDVFKWDATSGRIVPRPSGGGGGSITGIVSGPSGVDSIHYNTITLTTTCGLLGSISHVDVATLAAEPGGSTCTLPDAALSTTPGKYFIQVTDANLVAVAPTGSNTINGASSPLAAIQGPLASFDCTRRSDTSWYCAVTGSSGLGQVVTSHAYIFNETKTNSTTAEQAFPTVYTIPANFFTASTSLCLSLFINHISDATPSILFTYIHLNGNAAYFPAYGPTPAVSANVIYEQRWCMHGTAAPGASVGVLVAPMISPTATFDTSIYPSQPVLLATNSDLAIAPVVQWQSGTGGESFTILRATIEERH